MLYRMGSDTIMTEILSKFVNLTGHRDSNPDFSDAVVLVEPMCLKIKMLL